MKNSDKKIAKRLAEYLGVETNDLIQALERQVPIGMCRIARNEMLTNTREKPWSIEDTISQEVLRDLHYPVEEAPFATERLHGLVWRMINDRDNYTPQNARKLFAKQSEQHMRKTNIEKRWSEVCDLMAKFGYFEGFSIYDVIYMRDNSLTTPIASSVKRHGLTIVWQGTGIQGNEYARIGIDHNWNKMKDAAILLQWPEVRAYGKRRWQPIEHMLEQLLDPTSEEHARAMHDWDSWADENSVNTAQ